jgi:hypothetical protein
VSFFVVPYLPYLGCGKGTASAASGHVPYLPYLGCGKGTARCGASLPYHHPVPLRGGGYGSLRQARQSRCGKAVSGNSGETEVKTEAQVRQK